MRNAEYIPDTTAALALRSIHREERALRLRYRPTVYICSPYAGDVEHNVQNARRYCAFAVSEGKMPVAPHLFFPQFLDDGHLAGNEEDEEARELGLYFGLIQLNYCREVWYFGDTVSPGMRGELNRALELGKVIRHFNEDCVEVAI
jgi:hypothetical protein